MGDIVHAEHKLMVALLRSSLESKELLPAALASFKSHMDIKATTDPLNLCFLASPGLFSLFLLPILYWVLLLVSFFFLCEFKLCIQAALYDLRQVHCILFLFILDR